MPAYIFFPFPQAVRFKKLGAQSFVFLGGAPVSALGGRRRASVRCHLWADSAVSHPDGGKVGGNPLFMETTMNLHGNEYNTKSIG